MKLNAFTISMVILAVMTIGIITVGSKEHNSYSGAIHHLSTNGIVHITERDGTYHLIYLDNDDTTTKEERKCMDRLTDKYVVRVVDSVEQLIRLM